MQLFDRDAMSKFGPLKRGMRREDGKIFFSYSHGREVWYDEEKFSAEVQKSKEYYRNCKKIYSEKTHPELYTYDIHAKLYFVGMIGAKERWVTEQKMLELKKKNQIAVRNYILARKNIKKVPFKIGDPHPDIPGLFFTKYDGNKPMWRDHQGLLRFKESRNMSSSQCQRKRTIRRHHALKNIKNRIPKGTMRDGNIFWDYDSYGREIWFDPKEYQRRREQLTEKYRRYRQRRAASKNASPECDSG